ncbi:MAG: hypothetical protein AAFY41_00285 [Bacteroidota bacterium]
MKNILIFLFTAVALCLNAQLVTEGFDLSDGGWTGSSNGGNDPLRPVTQALPPLLLSSLMLVPEGIPCCH